MNEVRATTRGLIAMPLRDPNAFISAEVANEATRWRGSNYGGYANPTYDRLYEQSLVALDLKTRQDLIVEMLRIDAEDAASIHMFHDMQQQVLFVRKGVRGPGVVPTVQLATTWNIHTWDVE
jgi:ABC-type transport system substrate-binding protein